MLIDNVTTKVTRLFIILCQVNLTDRYGFLSAPNFELQAINFLQERYLFELEKIFMRFKSILIVIIFSVNLPLFANSVDLEVIVSQAQQGNVDAQYRLGLMFEKGNDVVEDPKQAVTWYHKAAEQGNANAQLSLGVMYDIGKGVMRDAKQAKFWYRKAAEQNNADAQFNLGEMYYREYPKEPRQAVIWYRKAAEQGDADAQFILGCMYMIGDGVVQDTKQAFIWFAISVANGVNEPDATKFRDATASMLTPTELSEAQAFVGH